MADIIRSLSYILTTTFPDNLPIGSITAAKMREVTVSQAAWSSGVGPAGRVQYPGVNISGLEFAPQTVPGVLYTNYINPLESEISYWAGKGVSVFRLPFLWERAQTTLNAALDSAYMTLIDNVITQANNRSIPVILDVHNYGYYGANLIGSGAVPTSAFANLWTRLATRYASNSMVMFGLMNEPHDQTAAQWIVIANAAIVAIRGAGATSQTILVPGTAWTGAHTWVSSGNAAAVGLGVVDSSNNYIFELHQYLDANSDGQTNTVVSKTIGRERMQAATDWARTNSKKLFLAEFGTGPGAAQLAAMDDQLSFLRDNGDVWIGFTQWSSGMWFFSSWNSSYPEVLAGGGTATITCDRPHLSVLSKYFAW